MASAAETPGRRASAPVMGLVTAAKGANAFFEGPESKWRNGIIYETEACVTPRSPKDICTPGNFDSGEIGSQPGSLEWTPYVVYADWECSTFSHNPNELEGHYEAARRRLLATWQFQMERELWTGELAQAQGYPNRWLADSANADNLSETGAVGLTHGLACLTQYLSSNSGGQQGMIHATPQVVTHWMGLDLLYRQGSVILTKARDDVVVGGNGYTGGSPYGDDPATGDIWAYATDIVEVREGQTDPEGIGGTAGKPVQWIDPTTNRIVIRSQKRALASFEGCRLGAVRLDVSACSFGGS